MQPGPFVLSQASVPRISLSINVGVHAYGETVVPGIHHIISSIIHPRWACMTELCTVASPDPVKVQPVLQTQVEKEASGALLIGQDVQTPFLP